jgi:hypothetical protein
LEYFFRDHIAPPENFTFDFLPIKNVDEADVNKCYTELLLFSENKEIIRTYLACFGILPELRPIQQSYRIKLLDLMREDLKFEAMHIEPDLVKFIVIP